MGFGPDIVEGSKANLKQAVAHLKRKYGAKTLTLKTITDPADRDWYRETKKEAQQAILENAEAIQWLDLQKKSTQLQKKIDADESGLVFHRNTLALMQIGILQKQPDGSYYAKQFLIDGPFLKLLDSVIRDKLFLILAHLKFLTGHNLKFDLNQWAYHLGLFGSARSNLGHDAPRPSFIWRAQASKPLTRCHLPLYRLCPKQG
jgi:hypothetical protein